MFLRIENNIFKFQIRMLNLSSMTMAKYVKKLVHDFSSSFLTDAELCFKDTGKRFTVAKLHNYEIMMIVFKKLINFINIWVINEF